jgi:dimethylargininase
MFRYAIVRRPGNNFSQGLTTVNLGKPDLEATHKQHEAYCLALEQCGLNLIHLLPDLDHPDSTFVEDTAILTEHCAILTNPGATSRKGEVSSIHEALIPFFDNFHSIEAPGTLDGGDICDAGSHFFIGVSERTNHTGAEQLAGFLAQYDYTSSIIDIQGIDDILHLKSGISYLGENNMVLIDSLVSHPCFSAYNIIQPDSNENYAANCVRVNECVIMAEGFPRLRGKIESSGSRVIPLHMSEYQKMDGGLSCLSLRF